MKKVNGFDLSDFSVDIYERDDDLRIRVDCFADDGVHAPFRVSEINLVSKTFAINEAALYHALSMTITKLINDIINSDIQRPKPCECQSREWFFKHPYDRQEYWRTNNGRIYPKDHTVHCPNNPCQPKEQPMTDNTYVLGADTEIKWMVHLTIANEVSREKEEYYTFFKTRAEADVYVKNLVNTMLERNVVIRIVKVKGFDGGDIWGRI